MPRRRSEEAELSRYVKKVKEFIGFELESVENYESLCSCHQCEIPAEIQAVLSFFKNKSYLEHPQALFYLDRAYKVAVEEYGLPTAATVLDFTTFRFRLFFLTLEKLGVLHGEG